jgi:hypothetical protein
VSVGGEAAAFARRIVAGVHPERAERAKALLFATARLAAFALSVGLQLDGQVLFKESVIERFVAVGHPAAERPVAHFVPISATSPPSCQSTGTLRRIHFPAIAPRPPTRKPRSPHIWPFATRSRRRCAVCAPMPSSASGQVPD